MLILSLGPKHAVKKLVFVNLPVILLVLPKLLLFINVSSDVDGLHVSFSVAEFGNFDIRGS
jgi:hypothetical protein